MCACRVGIVERHVLQKQEHAFPIGAVEALRLMSRGMSPAYPLSRKNIETRLDQLI